MESKPTASTAAQKDTTATSDYDLRAASECGWLLERSHLRLSLCLIMRDNARTIGPCLESIRPWVDEMVVVDTGSKDESMHIARRLGAQVFEFPWCDSFSAARNESFRHARGEWIIWMDSDDTIDAVNGRTVRELALRATDPSIIGYTMKVHCPGIGEDGDVQVTAVDQVHLVRNLPELRWDRRIHEQIIPAIRRAGGEVGFTDLFIVHSGSDRSADGQQRKLDRDLRLLQLELDKVPDHPFTLFNLGMTYRDARQYDRAIEFLKRSIERSGESESHLRKAHALLVSSYTLAGQHESASKVCQEGLRRFPSDAELRFQEGGIHSHFGRFPEAVASYRRVLEQEEEPHFASVEQGIQGYLTRHNLAVAYSNMGDLAQAEEQWRQVVEQSPTFRTAWRCLGDMLIRQGKYADAEALTAQLMGDCDLRAEGLMVKGLLAVARGNPADARRDLEKAVADRPGDVEPLRTLCQFLMEHADAADAVGPLKELALCNSPDGTTYHNLGTSWLRLGEFPQAIEACEESLRQRPDHPPTLLQLSYALKGAGRMDEAISIWERLVSAVPEHRCAKESRRELAQLKEEQRP